MADKKEGLSPEKARTDCVDEGTPGIVHRPRLTAITGGIGSGKSYVCRRLEAAGLPVFYCDAVAKAIIRGNAEVRRELTALVGPGVYDDEGHLVKSVLAAYLCGGREAAAGVDAIVHPRVAAAFRRWATGQTAPRAFMECALLYESGFDRLVDDVAVVVVPEALRLSRVMARDGVTAEKARAWMALQLPESVKMARADFHLRNDTEEHLRTDIATLLATDVARRTWADGENEMCQKGHTSL